MRYSRLPGCIFKCYCCGVLSYCYCPCAYGWLLCVHLVSDRMRSDVAVVCVSDKGQRNWESMFLNYLSDILHVCPGVLLQQKELVPHPTSFGAPERNSIGVLSCQPCGPPPPPCSPSQGPEPVPWRAEVGHDPQHHQCANFPSIHGHTTTTFCLLPSQWSVSSGFWSEYRISPHAVIYWSRKAPQTHIGRQTAPGTLTQKEKACQYWEGRQQFVTAQALVQFHKPVVKTNSAEFQAFSVCSSFKIESRISADGKWNNTREKQGRLIFKVFFKNQER